MLTEITAAGILLVDDEPANLKVLTRLLERAGFRSIRAISDPRDARAAFEAFAPDIVLLDLQMPHLDGFAVLEELRPLIPADGFVPIVVITGDMSPETRQRALSSGANDFLTKPFDATEVLLRIRNLLATRRLHLEVQAERDALDARVRQRTAELEEARLETLERLARAAEYRDDDTGQHARRVGDISALLAAELGMTPDRVELIRRAAPLHDVGKIGIPDAILLKTRPLTPAEYEVVRTHTQIGAELLAGSANPLLSMAAEIARYHHERWDGDGYLGLRGEEIPLTGRIVAVVDVFDALVNERPYKRAWPVTDALAELESQRGRQLDPEIVDVFLRVYARTGGFARADAEADRATLRAGTG